MLKTRCALWGVLAVSVCVLFSSFSFYGVDENPVPFTKVYWLDHGGPLSVKSSCPGCRAQVQRANLGGTGVEALVTELGWVHGIALDIGVSKMYWTEEWAYNPGDYFPPKIQRANLDGTEVQNIFTPDLRIVGLYAPAGIALDISAGKMYWTDRHITRTIQRANFDGTGFQILTTKGMYPPQRWDIELDVAAGKMYWSAWDAGKIQRANLDGTDIEDVITFAGLDAPLGIALDVIAGKVYWALLSEDSSKIQRANLDGTDIEDVITGLSYPWDIELDIAAGKMYWSDSAGYGNPQGKIQRANLDGTDVEDVVTGLEVPAGIALGN